MTVYGVRRTLSMQLRPRSDLWLSCKLETHWKGSVSHHSFTGARCITSPRAGCKSQEDIKELTWTPPICIEVNGHTQPLIGTHCINELVNTFSVTLEVSTSFNIT